jgi:hypothetical protein
MNEEAVQLHSLSAASTLPVLPILPVVIKNEKKSDRKSLGKESLEKVGLGTFRSNSARTCNPLHSTLLHSYTCFLYTMTVWVMSGVPMQTSAHCESCLWLTVWYYLAMLRSGEVDIHHPYLFWILYPFVKTCHHDWWAVKQITMYT